MLALAPALRAQSGHPRNPYDTQLAGFASALREASPPRAAVLLRRIYDLRDYVDEVDEVTRLIAQVANNPQQHPLVRDEALYLLARIDVHDNRLAASRAKLAQLGFVRQWSISGLYSASEGPDTKHAPDELEQGSEHWRTVPDFGPHPWVELSDFFIQTGAAVAYARTSLSSTAPRRVVLRFSAESAIAVFVNGSEIYRDDRETGIGFDQHAIAVQLRAGANSVILKLYRNEPGRWRFGLRVTEPCGAPAAACDLVTLAQQAADDDLSAQKLETLGRLERDHARGPWREHFEAAARRESTATRWLLVAQSCDEPPCRFAAFSAALKADPGNSAAELGLADYYIARNQLQKARDLSRDALTRTPEDFVIRERLADLYAAGGLNSLSLAECRRLQSDFPRPLWLRRELASRYVDLGLLDQAETLLNSSLPHSWDGEERTWLERIYGRRHDATRLRAAYTDAAQLNPTDTATLAHLGQMAAGAAEWDDAETNFRRALEIAPENDELHQQFAEILVSAGRMSDAPRELARALEINPQLAGAQRRLQSLGAQQEDPDRQYLADISQLAADARRATPAVDGNSLLLADIRVERVFDNGLSSVRVQQLFYVANRQGVRDLAARSVQYAPDTQRLEVLRARTIKHDGRVIEAEDAGEGPVAEPVAAMYYDVRARQLRFPGLEPGDLLELDYRVSPSTRKNAYGDYFGDLVVFGGSQPERLKRFVLITPEQRRFSVVAERMPAEAAVIVTENQRTYLWEARNLPALPSEARAPAITEVAPYVNVSTFTSWEELGRWYAQLVRPQFALDSGLRVTLTRILDGKESELDKVRAIHEFVLRNTHYVALEFGIYSYKPYPVSQTFARRFGDCKDKASLMIALLRAAGIEADIALVRTRRLGDISPQATSISVFNHAVAYLPKYGLWLDGTAEYAGSRELPLDDQGAIALTVAADGRAKLRRISVTSAGQNYTRRTVQAHIHPNGTIQFSGTAFSRGEDAPGLRREYEIVERQRDAFRDHLAEIFPSVRLDEVQVDGAHDLEHDVTVSFRGALDNFAGRHSLALAASWMPRSYVRTLAPLVSRVQPLVLPAPWTTEEEIHFALPAGAAVESMPANTALDTPFGSARLTFEQRGTELVVRTWVQFRALRIDPAEYAAFRDFCNQLERAFRGEVKVGL